MTNVGSRPPSASTDAMRLVVVVLPCVPATAMPCFRRISSASISARGTIGNSAFARRDDFRIVRRDRRRNDDRVGAGDVRRRMPDRDADAEPRKARGDRARGEIGSGDLIALRDEHFRDAAHPGAADADEMDALDLVLHRRRSESDARVGHAIRGIDARELAPGDGHREQRLARERGEACGEPLRREVAARESSAPRRASTRNCAFALCSSAIAPGKRHDDRGDADSRQLGHGDRAAAAEDEVGIGIVRCHVVDERHALRRDARLLVGGAQRIDVPRAGLMQHTRAERNGRSARAPAERSD